jgi:hypothetical protein
MTCLLCRPRRRGRSWALGSGQGRRRWSTGAHGARQNQSGSCRHYCRRGRGWKAHVVGQYALLDACGLVQQLWGFVAGLVRIQSPAVELRMNGGGDGGAGGPAGADRAGGGRGIARNRHSKHPHSKTSAQFYVVRPRHAVRLSALRRHPPYIIYIAHYT